MTKRTTLIWRKGPFPATGAFSKDQMDKLSRQFGISFNGMLELSETLEWILVFKMAYRTMSIMPAILEPQEGKKVFLKAIDELASAQSSLKKFDELISAISLRDTNMDGRSGDFEQYVKVRTAEADRMIQLLRVTLKAAVKFGRVSPDLAGAEEKRRGQPKDIIRRLVVDACLQLLTVEGKGAGYSTNVSTEEVGGPTIRFIEAVILELTVNRVPANASTLKTDIKRWRKSIKID